MNRGKRWQAQASICSGNRCSADLRRGSTTPREMKSKALAGQVAPAQSAEAGVLAPAQAGNAHLPLRRGEKRRFPPGFTASTRLRTKMKETKKQQPQSLMRQGRRISQRQASIWPQWNPSPMPLLRKCFSQNLQRARVFLICICSCPTLSVQCEWRPNHNISCCFYYWGHLPLSVSVALCPLLSHYTLIPFNLNILSNEITWSLIIDFHRIQKIEKVLSFH